MPTQITGTKTKTTTTKESFRVSGQDILGMLGIELAKENTKITIQKGTKKIDIINFSNEITIEVISKDSDTKNMIDEE